MCPNTSQSSLICRYTFIAVRFSRLAEFLCACLGVINWSVACVGYILVDRRDLKKNDTAYFIKPKLVCEKVS